MMDILFGQFKKELLGPNITPARAAEISAFITCGYQCGCPCENAEILKTNSEDIIRKVDSFTELFTPEEFSRLPDGVATRMRLAYSDASRKVCNCGSCEYVGDCVLI